MEDRIRDESMANLWNLWFTELNKGRAGLTMKVNNILYSGHSDFQRIDVLETAEFGKVLVLYGSVMITERDEFVYHEMISHTPLCVHPNPKNVLIIGGGDGGTLREVLKHKEVLQATQVEIDQQVCKLSQQFFPEVACEFENPRAKLVYDDGAVFLDENKDIYEVILADVSDPVGPAESVFQRSFHQNVYDHLTEDGIFVSQTESPFYHQDVIRKIYKNLNAIFPIVRMFLAYFPSYPSGMWSFAFCSKKYDPLTDLLNKIPADLRYYNRDIHQGAFALPTYVKDNITQ